jgi:hypothetical protein
MSHQINADQFTPEMHKQAEAEGWWLSRRDDGYFEIQTFDEDERHRFSSDDTARAYVAERALNGSYLHQMAMHFDGTLWRES